MRDRILLILKFLMLVVGIGVFVAIRESLPIISGYGAKVLCSGVFVAGRDPEQVIKNDLSSFPSNLGTYTVDRADSGHKPGEVFHYSSGTVNILSSIIRRTVGDSEYYRFPYEQLFYRIGMYSTMLEPDAGGTFVCSSYCYATARDWARFGMLYLQDGTWNGQRVLPEGWVEFTRRGGAVRSIVVVKQEWQASAYPAGLLWL